MSDEKPSIITTEDGSQSLFLGSLRETYHSHHGALQETMHVFIKNGLEFFQEKENVAVFEVGFGTGLNAICALEYGRKTNREINYTTIEFFPISTEIYRSYNKSWLVERELWDDFIKLHSSGWDKPIQVNRNFNFLKYRKDWRDFKPGHQVEVIFYDAFAPGKQPEMWSLDLLEKCFAMLNSGGILVTYCAQGQFKRNLLACGFKVVTLQGPPGKKEMVRAIKAK